MNRGTLPLPGMYRPPSGGLPVPTQMPRPPLPNGQLFMMGPPPPGSIVGPPPPGSMGLPPPGGPVPMVPRPVMMEPAPAPGGPPINAVYIQEPIPKSDPYPKPLQRPIPEPQPLPQPAPKPVQTSYGPPDYNAANTTTKLGAHIPLAKCKVLYIGTAIPTETSEGIKAVQEPLQKRYVTDGNTATSVPGVDAWLTVFSSGLLLQFITEGQASNNYVVWLPIHTLHVSAAVKCIPQMRANGERYSEFVALDSPAAESSDHPPIFATIMRRTKGVKLLECHTFICKSSAAAMALVESSTHAFEHKEGWMEDEEPKILQWLESTLDTQNVDSQPTQPLFQPSREKAKDRPTNKNNGYFLLLDNNSKMIKSYNVQHPNKVAPRPRPEPPLMPIPAEPQPAGSYVPAPGQYMVPAPYLADFGRRAPYAVWDFPAMVGDEKYNATVRERRRRAPQPDIRNYSTYDRVNADTLPPPAPRIYPELREVPGPAPPPPRPRPVMESMYMAPSRYDYQDDMGNNYYVGPELDAPYAYRGQFPDDLAYFAMPPPGDNSEYARFIAPVDPGEDRRYDDRRYASRYYDEQPYDTRRYDDRRYDDRRLEDPRYDDRFYAARPGGSYDEFGNVAGFYP